VYSDREADVGDQHHNEAGKGHYLSQPDCSAEVENWPSQIQIASHFQGGVVAQGDV
jgi:hypothetical protein